MVIATHVYFSSISNADFGKIIILMFILLVKLNQTYLVTKNNKVLLIKSTYSPLLFINHIVTDTLYLLNIKLNINLYNTTFITPGIRLHGTGVDTKNAGVDKKSPNRIGTVYVNVLFLDIIIFCNEIMSYNNCA